VYEKTASERHDEERFFVTVPEIGGLAALAVHGIIAPTNRAKASNAGKERITFLLRNRKHLIEIPFKCSVNYVIAGIKRSNLQIMPSDKTEIASAPPRNDK